VAEIVNLRQARKRRDRKAAEDQATANRAAFGRSKAQKQADAAEALRARRLLDQAKREDGFHLLPSLPGRRNRIC
jgi:hypothetical protein